MDNTDEQPSTAGNTDPQELVANAKRKLNKLTGEATTENTGILIRQLNYGVDFKKCFGEIKS